MNSHLMILAAVLSVPLCAGAADELTLHTFKKVQLSDQFWSEGANLGDFNKDGKMDVVSGPFWFEGPDFKKRHEYDVADKRKSPGGAAPFELKLGPLTKVTVPGFPGAHSQGESLPELRANLSEVIGMLLEDGEPKLEAEFVGTESVSVD